MKQKTKKGHGTNKTKLAAGFTLIELLIVIAIIAILAVVVVITLNPVEFLRQGRDSDRISDMYNLNQAMTLTQLDGLSYGNTNTVYISIPDPALSGTATSTCPNMGLPPAPTGWTYQCSSPQNFRRTDGTGWMPVNFQSAQEGSMFGALPVDPINSTSSFLYYTYVYGGNNQWQFTAHMESQKYISLEAGTGGADPATYTTGNSKSLAPFVGGMVGWWQFNAGSGSTASDTSGFGNTGTLSASGATWASGINGGAVQLDGNTGQVSIADNSSLHQTTALTVSAWFEQTSAVYGGTIAAKFGGGQGSWSLGLMNDSPYPSLSANGSAQTYYAFGSGSAWSLNTWHNIIMVYNGNAQSFQIYIDGNPYSSYGTVHGSPPSSIYPGTASLVFGGATDGNNFPGLISDVRVYQRILSTGEIQAIVNSKQ